MTQPSYTFLAVFAFAAACGHAADSGTAPAEYPTLPPAADLTTVTAPASVPASVPAPTTNSRFEALVSAADRSEADRALDGGRHPVEMLAFFDVRPGQTVAELASGTGYTAELLARAVGDAGKLYGVNNAFILEKFAAGPWEQRLASPVMKNVIRVDREFDAPFPEGVVGLDRVCNVLFYHDTVWMKTDRAAMNAHIFRALKSGGTYLIVDHAARDGHGVDDVQTFHRIEESLVRAEVEAAGFKFVESADFLRNPTDPRDWNASPRAAGERRGTSDRFALKFVKP